MTAPLSKEAYEALLLRHRSAVKPRLAELDLAIAAAASAGHSDVMLLRTMRMLLASGLFDPHFYLSTYEDIGLADLDPLEHYARHGDAEGRWPNPVFAPKYYRRKYLSSADAGANTLAHYVERGEAAGNWPNPAFDIGSYLKYYPDLRSIVDWPLFHFLRLGEQAEIGPFGRSSLPILQAARHFDASEQVDGHQFTILKIALVNEVGIENGFACCKALFNLPDYDRLEFKPIASLFAVAKERSRSFLQIAPAGEVFAVAPPQVIGKGNHRPLHGETRSVFVSCLANARVRGGSKFVDLGDVALLEYQGSELARSRDQLDFDPSVFHASDGGAWLVVPETDAVTVELAEAVTLLAGDSINFGDWMWSYLPKYLTAASHPAVRAVPVLVDERIPSKVVQAFELLWPEAELVKVPLFKTVHVHRLWCAASHCYMTVHEDAESARAVFEKAVCAAPPHRLAPAIRQMVRRAEGMLRPSTGIDRVFLARKPHLHRSLVNHAEIEAVARSHRFVVVYPEDLDFAEQARLLHHARFVAGPDGSAVFLGFFSKPGTKFCILSNSYTLRPQVMETGFLIELGMDVVVISGRYVAGEECLEPDDYEIDAVGFSEFLAGWLNDRTP